MDDVDAAKPAIRKQPAGKYGSKTDLTAKLLEHFVRRTLRSVRKEPGKQYIVRLRVPHLLGRRWRQWVVSFLVFELMSVAAVELHPRRARMMGSLPSKVS
jgi:hypothetical protein